MTRALERGALFPSPRGVRSAPRLLRRYKLKSPERVIGFCPTALESSTVTLPLRTSFLCFSSDLVNFSRDLVGPCFVFFLTRQGDENSGVGLMPSCPFPRWSRNTVCLFEFFCFFFAGFWIASACQKLAHFLLTQVLMNLVSVR